MYESGSYNNMADLAAHATAMLTKGFALHSWQAHEGLIFGDKTYFYSALYVQVQTPDKPAGMRAR